MSDKLTESVARLYRTGSKYSQQTEKLRCAVDNLFAWMQSNLPPNPKLPFNCKFYPSGEFTYEVFEECTVQQDFKLTKGAKHHVLDLTLFSILIADGFIDKIRDDLGMTLLIFSEATSKIEDHLKA